MKISYLFIKQVSYLLLLIFISSCVGKQGLNTIFQKRTPYEAYEHGLREAKLHKTALGQAWVAAGQQALRDSLLVTLPFQETGYFKAEKPVAASYVFMARQGEVIDVRVTTKAKQDIKLFLDLFELGNNQVRQAKHVAAADTTSLQLEYRVDGNQSHLVRLQPELLKSGSFTITIVAKPSLAFPVKGKDSRAVQSFWGQDRDGGKRKHEGVDIFAAKGTPVLASTDGIVSRVGESGLGGKVVWLSDIKLSQSLYYAHLDKQLVSAGQRVKAGDTLGLVGNTGNARFTVPHLHFGIYSFNRGAVDPYPFIQDKNTKPAPLRVNDAQIGQLGRTSKNKTVLRNGPSNKATALATLPKDTPIEILGGTSEWYRVQLPNGKPGFLQGNLVESLAKPIKTQSLKNEAELMEKPETLAVPIAKVKKNEEVTVLGFYESYQLIKLADGTVGWLVRS
ncbi:peptidoglycan DD-metalloendopeptidase family protein [Adhaeribacter aquaticus]|uniref:peptidoglycan DD-metalloendopeptidase family protein n=1 Tax=Adhaeribacter aquaticus TaxID=299567 RepID=UPI0004081D91|nr:peptidoglycan DD-metalloendopeptidase family protein [Adhaeribacter aquaticus]